MKVLLVKCLHVKYNFFIIIVIILVFLLISILVLNSKEISFQNCSQIFSIATKTVYFKIMCVFNLYKNNTIHICKYIDFILFPPKCLYYPVISISITFLSNLCLPMRLWP